MAGPEPKDDAPMESEEERGTARRAADADVDPREEEGWDQPQSSAQKIPHRQDDQDDVQ